MSPLNHFEVYTPTASKEITHSNFCLNSVLLEVCCGYPKQIVLRVILYITQLVMPNLVTYVYALIFAGLNFWVFRFADHKFSIFLQLVG